MGVRLSGASFAAVATSLAAGATGVGLTLTGALAAASVDASGEVECGTLDCLGAGVVAGALTEGGGETVVPTVHASGNLSLTQAHRIVICTSGSATSVTFPASPVDGELHTIKRRGAGTVTVQRNGKNIDGAAADDTLGTNGDAKSYVYSSAQGSWYYVSGTGTF